MSSGKSKQAPEERQKPAAEGKPREKETQPSQPQENLYKREMERYRAHLQRGFEQAYKIYGFTLFHSLLPEEKVEIFQQLGFEPKNPEDFFNVGCIAAKKEDYAKACEHFRKTIELAEDFEQAYYNLAICLEHLGELKDAIENWQIYYAFLNEDSSEALMIAKHIEELKESASGKGSKK
jgi:tetratricopeptide (TPR) repeat protein